MSHIGDRLHPRAQGSWTTGGRPTAIGRTSDAGLAAVGVARRRLQVALGVLWLIDGLLQLQPYMFTGAFASDVLAGSATGNSDWIAASIEWAARIVRSDPLLINAAFAGVQLAIGIALLMRRTATAALGVSVVWALGVWWFGEGLGGLLAGPASALTGAPGAALLYALLAILLWPPAGARAQPFVAAGLIGVTAARVTWLVVWVGLALLNLEPDHLRPDGLSSAVRDAGDGQPAWLAAPGRAFSTIADHHGLVLTLVGAGVLAAIGVAVLLPPSWGRASVGVAVLAAAFIWVVGQALGAPFGGRSTDPDSGPLLILLALAYWPRADRPVDRSPRVPART